MPLYSYLCEGCGHTFDELHSIANRKTPEGNPCPSCNEKKVIQTIGAVNIVAGVGHVYSKVPDGFRDILKNVKKNSGSRCTIDV